MAGDRQGCGYEEVIAGCSPPKPLPHHPLQSTGLTRTSLGRPTVPAYHPAAGEDRPALHQLTLDGVKDMPRSHIWPPEVHGSWEGRERRAGYGAPSPPAPPTTLNSSSASITCRGFK